MPAWYTRWGRRLSCEVLTGRDVVLPLCFFLLGVCALLAFAAVFNAEWIFTDPGRNSSLYGTNVTQVYNGLFNLCTDVCFPSGTGTTVCQYGDCQPLNFLLLGPSSAPACYLPLQGTYGVVSGLIFGGIAMCFVTGFMVWYRIRRLQKKPHRYRRDQRRSACSGFIMSVLFLVAFIIFMTSQGNAYLCPLPYSYNGSFGVCPFYILATAIISAVITALLWFPNLRASGPGFTPSATEAMEMVEGDPDPDPPARSLPPATQADPPRPAKRPPSGPPALEIPDPEEGFEGMFPLPPSVEALTPLHPPRRVFDSLLENHPQLKRMGAIFFAETQERLRRLQTEQEYFKSIDSLFVRMDAEQRIVQDRFPPPPPPPPQRPRYSNPEEVSIPILQVIEPTVVLSPKKEPERPRGTGAPRPTLGVEIRVEEGDAPDKSRIVAHRLVDNGPAAEAGVEAGDILESWNGKPLQSKQAFAKCLKNSALGETVTLGLMRDGVYLEISVEIGGVAPPS